MLCISTLMMTPLQSLSVKGFMCHHLNTHTMYVYVRVYAYKAVPPSVSEKKLTLHYSDQRVTSVDKILNQSLSKKVTS